MTPKRIKVLTELLGLSEVKVISQRQHKGIGVILQIEPTRKESICPKCGTKSHRLHQNRRHIVKDLPWGEQQVFLEINRRQLKLDTSKLLAILNVRTQEIIKITLISWGA
ncbi:transposase [Mastigocladus laminosus UU774]|nr:transposase [Mastigocladus laminosus UU774]